MVVETFEFNGRTYRRYPESKRRQHRVYFQFHDKRDETPRYLHRDIWEFHHGSIPKGHHIHHVDGNPLNNALDNLMCVDKKTHAKLDAERGANRTPAVFANLERIRPLASEWHRSEEGKQWHSRNAKQAWEKRQPSDCVCRWCGKSFQSMFSDAQVCSNNCSSAERRASGKDDEDRSCAVCGVAFRTNKYSKTKTCSRKCGVALRNRNRAGVQPDGGGGA